jgi:hypothetical protein
LLLANGLKSFGAGGSVQSVMMVCAGQRSSLRSVQYAPVNSSVRPPLNRNIFLASVSMQIMKMKTLIVAASSVCLVLLVASYWTYTRHIYSWNATLNSDWLLDRRTEHAATRTRISEIVLERSGCFGICPIYRITLRKDRTASYVGKRHVEKVGNYYGEAWQFDRLAHWIEMEHFSSFESEYEKGISDADVVRTSIVLDGRRKTVTTYASGGGPIELWAINAAIDGVAANIRWKKRQ